MRRRVRVVPSTKDCVNQMACSASARNAAATCGIPTIIILASTPAMRTPTVVTVSTVHLYSILFRLLAATPALNETVFGNCFLITNYSIAFVAKLWEVRGLFGNEYAMENAVEEIRKLKDVQYKMLDRRNLQVVLKRGDESTKALVRNIIKIAHGYVEGEGVPGEIDREKEKRRLEKVKEFEEKKRATKSKH